MNSLVRNDIDLAISAAARRAVRGFATALVETPQFQAFEQASVALNGDEVAQRAMEAHQARQESLRMLLMLNAVSDADRAELENLRLAVLAQPAVSAYLDAEQTLIGLLQSVADVVSERIGLPFAVSRSKCCG
jgi:cell fate (sporulation/competence/biofilm development) regulator YlbF (YheA/YmcA/DUF963 family)